MAGKLSTVILALTIALHPTPVLAPISFCLPDKVQEQVSRGGQQVMVMEATAYTWTGCRTATGIWPSRGTVAVDPNVIPLGSVLYVEGYGEAIAADTGGAVKGNIIDIYLPTEAECWQWGRQQVEVRVIEP